MFAKVCASVMVFSLILLFAFISLAKVISHICANSEARENVNDFILAAFKFCNRTASDVTVI